MSEKCLIQVMTPIDVCEQLYNWYPINMVIVEVPPVWVTCKAHLYMAALHDAGWLSCPMCSGAAIALHYLSMWIKNQIIMHALGTAANMSCVCKYIKRGVLVKGGCKIPTRCDRFSNCLQGRITGSHLISQFTYLHAGTYGSVGGGRKKYQYTVNR